eukprot:12540892-Alexandrium_andersonii.AAC.1
MHNAHAALACHHRRARAPRMARLSRLADSAHEGALGGGVVAVVRLPHRALADGHRACSLVAEAPLG